MLMVKTRLSPSRIHGIGLFATEAIPAGTVVWRYHAPFDVVFHEDDLDGIPEVTRGTILKYAYWSDAQDGYVLCGDDARFMNHSDDANTYEDPEATVAARDIAVGEEITCDYRQLDPPPPGKEALWDDFSPYDVPRGDG